MGLKSRVNSMVAKAVGVTALTQRIDRVAVDLDKRIATELSRVDRGGQLLIGFRYRELTEKGILLPFDDVEFRNYSQNGEDGILWYVFSVIGALNKTWGDALLLVVGADDDADGRLERRLDQTPGAPAGEDAQKDRVTQVCPQHAQDHEQQEGLENDSDDRIHRRLQRSIQRWNPSFIGRRG